MKFRELEIIEQKKNNKIGKYFWHLISFLLLVALCATAVFAINVYKRDSRISAQAENLSGLKKNDQIKVNFTRDMLIRTVDEGFTIWPELEVEKNWNGKRELSISLAQVPKPATEYLITIQGAKSSLFIPQRNFTISFATEEYPQIISIYPENGQTEVDFFESIKMKLDKPLGENFISEIMVDPLTGFDYVLDESEKELTIVPTEKLEQETVYKIRVKLRHRYYDDIEKIIYEGGFKTRLPSLVAYSFDKSGQPSRTEERQEEVFAQVKEGRYIDIDLSSQTLFIFENSMEKGAFKVSTGKSGMNTPEGTFRVMAKSQRPWSRKYGLFMPWFIQFTNIGHGIHELPEWPGGYKEGANHLGTPVSHGCVRLGVGSAKMVYDFVEVDTPIIIHQ